MFRLFEKTLMAIHGVPTRQGGPRGDGLFCRICVRVVSTACFFLDGARAAVRCRGLTTIAGATAGHTLLWRPPRSLHCSVCECSKREVIAAVGESFLELTSGGSGRLGWTPEFKSYLKGVSLDVKSHATRGAESTGW